MPPKAFSNTSYYEKTLTIWIVLTNHRDAQTLLNKHTTKMNYASIPTSKNNYNTSIFNTDYQSHNQLESIFTITSRGKDHVVHINSIIYIEANHVYVNIVTLDGKKLMYRGSLKEFLSKLPPNQFIQTHRSFVVNLQYVSAWNRQEVLVGDQSIPVSRNRWSVVKTYFEEY